jgi:hypothetical protein
MLTRLVGLAVVAVAAIATLATGPAHAADPILCAPGAECIIEVVGPGSPGQPGSPSGPGTQPVNDGTGGGGSEPQCEDPLGNPVDCYLPAFGWWNPADKCHWRLADPQPPVGHSAWEGNTDGAIYLVVCMSVPGTGGGFRWSATPPPGFGGAGPTPEELAQRAVEQLPLAQPQIGMTPTPGRTGLVGLPVWLWLEGGIWTPVSATASVPGLSVTATATPVRVVWDMGDGTTVTCRTAGVPYRASAGDAMSPECGHRYERPSSAEPDEAYDVTATVTWDIQWAGGGASGDLTQVRSATAQARIGELQVVVS